MPVKSPPGLAQLRRLRLQHGDRHEFLRDDDLGIGRDRRARRRPHVVETRGPEGAELQVAAFDPAELAQAHA
jgi:hypothetical protein